MGQGMGRGQGRSLTLGIWKNGRAGLSVALVCAGLAGSLATPLTAQQAETAPPLPSMTSIEQAWAQGDFVTVRQGLERLAVDEGSALAQYRFGRVLLEGRGGPQDVAGAVDWLTKAVAQNDLAATTLLARAWLSDLPGLPRDPRKAAVLLTRAAPRGDPEAQYLLGLLLRAGEGVPRDPATAATWFLAAAEGGHAEAQLTLALAQLAPGPDQAVDTGMAWLNEAAAQGLPQAQWHLAQQLETNGQPAEALRWLRRAAEAGHVLAQRDLGTRYLDGDAPQDAQEALRWLTEAARAGDAGAMHNLGLSYARGAGLPQDLAQARDWLSRAAQYGLGRSMVVLGQLTESGVGPDTPESAAKESLAARQEAAAELYLAALQTNDRDMARRALARLALADPGRADLAPHRLAPWVLALALEDPTQQEAAIGWLTTHAEAEVTPAQAALGQLLLTTTPDAALDWLRRAAEANDASAQFALAEALAAGTAGAAPDYVTAHMWYNLAATQGHRASAARRDVLGNLMTPEQIAEAQTAARVFFESGGPQPPATQP